MDDRQRAAAAAALPVAWAVARRFARSFPAWWDEIEEAANYLTAVLVFEWDPARCPDYGDHLGRALSRRLINALCHWGALPASNGRYLLVSRREYADLRTIEAPDDGGPSRAAEVADEMARVRSRLGPKSRQELDLYLECGLSPVAMADRLGISLRTAERRARKVREAVVAVEPTVKRHRIRRGTTSPSTDEDSFSMTPQDAPTRSESDCRRPGWRPGVPVRLADGAEWHLPRPRVGFRVTTDADGRALAVRHSSSFGDDYIAQITKVLKPESDDEYFGTLAGLALQLLRTNYDISAAEVERLFTFDLDDQAMRESWLTIKDTVLGFGPKV